MIKAVGADAERGRTAAAVDEDPLLAADFLWRFYEPKTRRVVQRLHRRPEPGERFKIRI